MPAHRVRPARSPDRPPLHPTTLPGTGPHPTEPSGRSAPVASARSPNEPIGGRKNTNRETDATGHTANTPSASRSTAFPPPPENGHAADTDDKKRTLPLVQTVRRSEGNGPKRIGPLRPDAPQALVGLPVHRFSSPKTAMQQTRTTKTHSHLAQTVRRSEGNGPKRIGPLRPDAPQMPPPGLPPRRFFLPRRREPDTMRTEESERQAKGKRRKRHKRQEGERETRRQETEKTRKTDSPENVFGPAATVCGRAESFEDRRSGQPEPSRFRTLSIGNNRLCKVLRH